MDQWIKYRIREKERTTRCQCFLSYRKKVKSQWFNSKVGYSFRICQVESYHQKLLHFLSKRLNYLVNNDGLCLNSIFTFEKLWVYNIILPFSRMILRSYKRQPVCGGWWQIKPGPNLHGTYSPVIRKEEKGFMVYLQIPLWEGCSLMVWLSKGDDRLSCEEKRGGVSKWGVSYDVNGAW